DEIRDVHGTEAALPVVCDVSDHAALKRLVALTTETFGGLDILVNNAGIGVPNSAFQDEESYEANWAKILDVNLTAHSRLIRLCLTALQASEAGRVVNIASTETIVTTPGMAGY
ncbi:MAG TPA: SDR family oxidoreductase, partial [Ilumatobacteraceae bacterium]|nr:SDR family oxidoreductase [Ilumatobacteraceae bacterium]